MFNALLLAGGKSSRMGEDKRQLVIDGQSLFERARLLLEACGAERVLISGNVEGIECIPDILSDCGPLGGIHAALHHLKGTIGLTDSLLLVIPVDMPLLDAGSLTRLVESIGDEGSCHYEGEIFPCVLRADAALQQYLDDLFAGSRELGGQRSMKALLGHFSEKPVSRKGLPDNFFMNLNRPEDWELFLDLMA